MQYNKRNKCINTSYKNKHVRSQRWWNLGNILHTLTYDPQFEGRSERSLLRMIRRESRIKPATRERMMFENPEQYDDIPF